MTSTFSSINQAPQGAAPQFQQTQAVSDGTASTLGQAASLGNTLFQSVAKANAASAKQEAATAKDTALGGLQQKLLDIKMAGETGDVDVVREQRKAISAFNANYPALRTDASAMYKAETGQAPAQSSPEEEAESKLKMEALSKGYGRHNASEEHNEEQYELYLQMKRADEQNAARLQELNLIKQRGDISKEVVQKEVLSSFREMTGLGYKKAASDAQSLMTGVADGTLPLEEALLTIRKKRIEVNRTIASLGEYASNSEVQAYVQPILDEYQLAEDVVNGTIEQSAAKSIIATNKARSQAIFYSDANRVNLAVTSEIFGHTVGFTNKMTAPAYKFLADGLTKDGMVPNMPRPVDPRDLEADGKLGVKGTVTNALNSGDPKSVAEVGALLSGVAEHLSRNGMDYDASEKDFVIELLSTPKAMESLSSEQKDAVMMGFEMYVVDDTKVAADKLITTPPKVTVSAPARAMGGHTKEVKDMVDIADITVSEGRIYWAIKPEYASNGILQQMIRTTNRKIASDVTPVVNILSKGSGTGFEEVTRGVIFGESAEGGGEEVKK